MKITIINKILLCFICSIVPYISIKGQCLDSLKSVCLPDSIAEQIENNYEDKYTNASKNVVNLISPNNYNFVDGIYAFKGMGPHFPRQIFVYNLKSATTRLYDTEAKIICIVSKKGAQCIECHHKDI